MAQESSTCEFKQTKSTKPHDSFSDWSSLPSDLLKEIFHHLSAIDIYRSKHVCRSWQFDAQSHIKNMLPKSPLFLLPDEGPNNSSLIFTLENDSSRPIQIPYGSHCIGSSRGWLFLLQGRTNLALWSPIFDVKVRLPCLQSILSHTYFQDRPISKAVVCCSDPLSSDNYGVVLLPRYGSKLWFAMCGDSKWSLLGDTYASYTDISCHDNLVMAIQHEYVEKGIYEVEGWDFSSGGPVKMMNLKVEFHGSVVEFEKHLIEYYSWQSYIIESNSETLRVLRCIEGNVGPNGVRLEIDDFLEEEDCTYWTRKFYIYKLDFDNLTWVSVKDLGNRVLFVGGNESKAFTVDDMPMCKKNSIYFTDDFWSEIVWRSNFRGHDMGIYNLEDGSINFIHQLHQKTSPPFWVLPH